MGRRVFDILIILISGFIGYLTSSSRLQLDQYSEEWSGIQLVIYPFFVAAFTVIMYLLTLLSKDFYNKYRWWIVGILCSINLLSGILLNLGLFG